MTQPTLPPSPPPHFTHPWGFFVGFTYPFKAFTFLCHHSTLWQYILIPICVNFFMAIGLYLGLLFPGLQGINILGNRLSISLNSFLTTLPKWLHFLTIFGNFFTGLLQAILIIILGLIVGFLTVQFGVILGAPWYGQLSEELEKILIGQVPDIDMSFRGILREIKRSLGFELSKLKWMVMIGLPLFLINFIPGIGLIVATLGGLGLGTTLVSLDFLSPALDRRQLNFQQKFNFFRKYLPTTASFGLICLGLVSIPFLSLFTIPLCVTGGTLFYCDHVDHS